MIKKSKMARICSLAVATVMSCSLLFTACGNGGENETTTKPNNGITNNPTPVSDISGAYHYKDSIVRSIPAGKGFGGLLYFDVDGKLIFLENYPDAIYKVNDGGDAEELLLIPDRNEGWEPPSETDYTGSHAIRGYDVDENGNYYILYSVMGCGDFMLDIYDKDGNPVKNGVSFDNIRADDTYGMVDNFKFYDGMLFILWNLELQVNSIDGEQLDHSFQNYRIHDIDIDVLGNMWLSVSVNERNGTYELLMADIEDDYNVLDRVSIPNGSAEYISCVQEMETVFFADYKNVYRYTRGDGKPEKELSFGEDISFVLGNDYNSGLPVLDGFAVNASSEIYLVTDTMTEGSHIYKLEKNAGEKPVPEIATTLTITAAYRQDYLEEAVRRYINDNPEVEIVWDVIYGTKDEFYDDVEAAGKKLATKIMTNDVGDIVATGGMGLVYLDIFQTDAFIDLTEYIENDDIYDIINKHVLDGMTLDGELKGLPVGTGYVSLVYNKELGNSLGLSINASEKWSDILKIGLDNPGVTLFGMLSKAGLRDELLVPMLTNQMPDLIDLDGKEVDLNQEWFLKLLTDFKAVYEQGNLTIPVTDFSFFSKMEREYLYEIHVIQGQYDHRQLYYENAEGAIAYLPMPAGEQNRNTIAYALPMYSISNNSSQKDEAWEFLSYLLTTDMQTSYSLGSSPINTEAEKKIRKKHGGFPSEMDEQFDAILNTIDYLYDMSYYKADIADPIMEYIDNKITLEQAIEKAEYNVWIRMNE